MLRWMPYVLKGFLHLKQTEKMKERLLDAIYNPKFYFLDLKFQSFWAKSKIFQTFFNSKACFWGPESHINTPTIQDL